MRRVREISMICLTKIIDDSVIVVLICQASHNLKILMFPPSIEIYVVQCLRSNYTLHFFPNFMKRLLSAALVFLYKNMDIKQFRVLHRSKGGLSVQMT